MSKTAFLRAIVDDDLPRATELLEADRSLAAARGEDGVSALLVALYHGRAAAAALVERYLAELDLFEAAATGDATRVSSLVDADPSAVHARSADGFTALHLACFFGRLDAARALVARAADVDSVAGNPSRVRPLHSAAARRDARIAELLLEAGADVNAAQAGGWTALMAAAKHGDRELVELLLARGAHRGAQAEDGKTALDLATASVADLLS